MFVHSMDGRDPKIHAQQEAVRLARLRNARPAIDNAVPKGLVKGSNGKVTRRVDRRKEMKEEAMRQYMIKENEILKRRVREMAQADAKARTAHTEFRSVNKVSQEKEARRIANDNEILSKNIANCRPELNMKELERDTKRMQAQWERNPYTILRQNNKAKIAHENKVNKIRLKKNGRAFYNVAEFERDVQRMKKKLLKGEPEWKKKQDRIKRENKHVQASLKKNGRAYYSVKKWEEDVRRMKNSIVKGVPDWQRKANEINAENRRFYKLLENTKPQIGSRKEWKKDRDRIEKAIIWTCSLKAGRLGRNVAPLLFKTDSPRAPSGSQSARAARSPRRKASPRRPHSARMTEGGSFRAKQYKDFGVPTPQRPKSSGNKSSSARNPRRKNYMLLGYL